MLATANVELHWQTSLLGLQIVCLSSIPKQLAQHLWPKGPGSGCAPNVEQTQESHVGLKL